MFLFREIALMSKGATAEPSNPFGEIEEEDEDDAEAEADEAESLDVAIPEWLAELPDDLEVSDSVLFLGFSVFFQLERILTVPFRSLLLFVRTAVPVFSRALVL